MFLHSNMVHYEGWANLGMSQYRHLADISVEDGYSEVISPGESRSRTIDDAECNDRQHECMYVCMTAEVCRSIYVYFYATKSTQLNSGSGGK